MQYTTANISNEANHTDIANILKEIDKTNDNIDSNAAIFCENNVKTARGNEHKLKEDVEIIKNEVQTGVSEVIIHLPSSQIDTYVYHFIKKTNTNFVFNL